MKMQKREKEGRTEKIKPQKQAILILLLIRLRLLSSLLKSPETFDYLFRFAAAIGMVQIGLVASPKVLSTSMVQTIIQV
jgi:hypothetical protein